jgi:hypothetical protein
MFARDGSRGRRCHQRSRGATLCGGQVRRQERNVLVLYVVLVSMERCFMSTRCDHNTIIMLSTECAEELRHIILEAEESGVGQREE